jgi:hypothetical protein
VVLVVESLAQYVEGREKTRSGEASAGQFPMREEIQSSREGVTNWSHPPDVPMDKQTASTW